MSRKLWNGIWATELRAGSSTVLVTDHGAHVVSWKPAGKEALFFSERSKLGEGVSLRGGVPIIFPQFNQRGNGMRHGFARVVAWKPLEEGQRGGSSYVRYGLTQAATGGFGWTQAFMAAYEVELSSVGTLSMSLQVVNHSDRPLSFTGALHTYLRVNDIGNVRVEGLKDVRYMDCVADGRLCDQPDEFFTKVEDVDYIFGGVPGVARLHDGTRVVTSAQTGFPDMVMWNPGSETAKLMSDLLPEDYRHFLCMEAAAVEQPVVLPPGSQWRGEQQLSVSS